MRARSSVGPESTASYLPLTSFTMVKVASPPLELKARPSVESKPAASGPEPMAGVAMTFQLAISVTAIILLLQTEKSFLLFTSIAKPDGPSQGASDILRLDWES